ncbi:MAG TPA: hydrogenase expression/formation protein HypE [Tepidanaerobacteraceae bacterium]|nr:hydrogenase expression/formation protein HypE [Tepidanaerobacteraceae bacterium]
MDIVLSAHGGGGKLTEELIQEVFLNEFDSDILNEMEDSAVLDIDFNKLAFTTDSYTVKPLFFPGGDIGRLAVCGTINDLLTRGAVPLFLSASFIIEEGFRLYDLKRIASSMARTCREAGVKIVAGDTKVVARGDADGIFINTSGAGYVPFGVNISVKNAKPGDKVIISGTIGDHGMAVLSSREDFTFDPPLESDCAPLADIVNTLRSFGESVRVLRDPTRAGVAEVLYNISRASGVGIEIYEEKLPVKPQVASACNMLGLDFLQLANEGKLVAVVESSAAEKILEAIKKYKNGRKAAIIGTVNDSGQVTVRTVLGTSRILSRPVGELVPRIC